MKQRDKTERIIKAEINVTVVRSKAELRTGTAVVNNIDRIGCCFLFLFLFMYLHKYMK